MSRPQTKQGCKQSIVIFLNRGSGGGNGKDIVIIQSGNSRSRLANKSLAKT